jgi:hypothetical protein
VHQQWPKKEKKGWNFFSWDPMMAKKWKEKVVSFLFLGFGDGQRKRKKGCKQKIVGFNTGQKKRRRDCKFFFMSFGHGRFGVCKKILMILHHKLAPSLYECFYNTLTICSTFNVDTIIDMMLR